MKNLVSYLIVIAFLSSSFMSCKKSEDSDAENNSFRLIETSFQTPEYGQTLNRKYLYSGNKLTHFESQEAGDRYVADYSYLTDTIMSSVKIYSDTILEQLFSLKYFFEDGMLLAIISIPATPSDDPNYSLIEFKYTDGRLIEYIDYNGEIPNAKAIYDYEGEKLSKFTLYFFKDNDWVKWYSDEFTYNENLIDEVITSTAIVEPSNFMLISKMVYQYQDNRLNIIDVYSREMESWGLSYFIDHNYDQNDNLIKKEYRYIQDSSMMYFFEYQYEEGESNLEEIIYLGFTYDMPLQYPTPNRLMSKHLLSTLLKEKR